MEILMHRESHFGSSFAVMLQYYKQNGVGIMPDFEIEEIEKLKQLEEEAKEDLASTYLPEAAKAVVEEAKKLYQGLKDIYSDTSSDPLSILLSDLILSEEETPDEEMDKIVDQGEAIVPMLIHLVSADMFYDPLFPGYGRAPIFGARCLSRIQDERAIPPLFEALGHNNFFTDEEIIQSLCSFGESAKSFLIKMLLKKPYSKDNEYAAIALNSFSDDPEVSLPCLNLLEEEDVLKRSSLATYLIFTCSYLSEENERERFIKISKNPKLPRGLREEMELVIKNWKSP